jgi:hypothetical protein
MSKRLLAFCLIGAAAFAGIAFANADKSAPASNDHEHDFGTKILVVGMPPRPGEEEGTNHVLEKARIRRLGDRYFLVGRWLDFGEATAFAGTTMWTPLSDIDQIMEFDNLEAVKKAYPARDKEKRGR